MREGGRSVHVAMIAYSLECSASCYAMLCTFTLYGSQVWSRLHGSLINKKYVNCYPLFPGKTGMVYDLNWQENNFHTIITRPHSGA